MAGPKGQRVELSVKHKLGYGEATTESFATSRGRELKVAEFTHTVALAEVTSTGRFILHSEAVGIS